MQNSPSVAEAAAGGRRLRRRARGTWGRLHPPLHSTPRLNGWTLNGTAGMGGTREQGIKNGSVEALDCFPTLTP